MKTKHTTETYKNQVTASSFLEWYFSDSDDVLTLGDRTIEELLKNGTFTITTKELFERCGYIPQHICEDSSGGEEYHSFEVEFIQD